MGEGRWFEGGRLFQALDGGVVVGCDADLGLVIGSSDSTPIKIYSVNRNTQAIGVVSTRYVRFR